MRTWTVAADGSGDYTTIQGAIDAIRVDWQEWTVLQIKNGVYNEKIVIPDNKPLISLVGESREGTIISGCDYARIIGQDGKEIGTFRTAVLEIHADDITVTNLTVRNTAGYGPAIEQAVAVYASGDRIAFSRVTMLANQDTLYTCKGRQYYEQCYIEGHVDFIFGAATAVFDRCEIHSLRSGYITAASTSEHTEFGYVFLDCRLTGSADEATVFLGRPWRPHAHTVFVRTWMGPHIKPEGWDNWRDTNNEKTARYAEAGSTGPGASIAKRVGWSSQLDDETAAELTVDRIFNRRDGWNPANTPE